jgi:nitrous oxide reductase accessory protein NosL
MFVAPYPHWLSALVFKDGSHAFFDGPKDMFKYIFNPKRYDRSKQAAEIEAIFVTDYYKVTRIDGKKAWYVTGSDVSGPMGNELIPFEKESDARAFLTDHRGKKVFAFEEITPEIAGLQDDPSGHGSHSHKGQ